jgi:NitT/TauT family transport system permease protein
MKRYIKIISPIILILVWELLAIYINNEYILPRVGSVFLVILQPFTDILGSGSLAENAIVSLYRVVVGFLLGALAAIPLGILMGRMQWVNEFFDPII